LDVALIGAGGGGLVAALTAGTGTSARVSPFEATDVVGGTCAFSAGQVWAVGTRQEHEAGSADNLEEGLAHIRRLGVGRLDCFAVSFEPTAMSDVNLARSSSDRRRPSSSAWIRADIRSSWGVHWTIGRQPQPKVAEVILRVLPCLKRVKGGPSDFAR
jgi:hypothetical protein